MIALSRVQPFELNLFKRGCSGSRGEPRLVDPNERAKELGPDSLLTLVYIRLPADTGRQERSEHDFESLEHSQSPVPDDYLLLLSNFALFAQAGRPRIVHTKEYKYKSLFHESLLIVLAKPKHTALAQWSRSGNSVFPV